jgi:RNA polymerase sigma-70 factor (ECF subfamily)
MVELLPRLRRFAVALTGDLDQADDLVQEACMRALSRVEQWQPGTRLDSWMYRIAQNLWLDRMRAKKVRGEQVDVESAEALAGPDGREVVESRLTLNAVSAAMAYLPNEQRMLIALVCIDGLSYKEAAEITETPIGTVMSRLARARRELHARLEDRAPQASPRSQTSKPGATHDRNPDPTDLDQAPGRANHRRGHHGLRRRCARTRSAARRPRRSGESFPH